MKHRAVLTLQDGRRVVFSIEGEDAATIERALRLLLANADPIVTALLAGTIPAGGLDIWNPPIETPKASD